MLAYLTTAFSILLVVVNLIGLALAGLSVTRSYLLSRVASPLALALAAFFVEHSVGLGRLGWVWPISTAASAWLIARRFDQLREHWRVELAFLVSFEWVFLWRFAYPGIVASSEKIGDLAMISSYLPGSTLPPMDAWLPPYPFDVYYSFQHYAAALLGRVFALDPGITYNLAFCLIVALTLTAAIGCAFAITRSARATALVVLAFAVGGTGASVPVHFMMRDPQLYSSMRFIGGAATPARADTPFGKAVVAASGQAQPVELPSETFAYLLSLGDYHPPMSGFYLLALALLCIALVETDRERRVSQAVLAATPMLCALANGWTLPLQLALVAAWVAYRVYARRPPDWTMLGAGFLGAALASYPFLKSFAYHSLDYGIRILPVRPGEHTPLLLGAIVLFPILAGGALSLVAPERRGWPGWSALLWFGLLLFSEIFYIDDVYGGAFNRFNTTLKWWPWIQAGLLLMSGAYALRSRSALVRRGMAVVLVVVSLYGYDMGRGLLARGKVDAGRLDGAAWITTDPAERAILEFLRAQPRSIVLQRLDAGAFTPAPGLTLLAGQVAFMGWPEHEKLWRGYRVDVDERAREVAAFYAGELPRSVEWLVMNHIDHVLWLKSEGKLPPAAFARIDEQLRGRYRWREYYRVGDFRVGVWSRVGDAPAPALP